MSLRSSQRRDADLPDPRSPWAVPKPSRRILVAVKGDGSSAIALQRADAVAKTLSAELYAVHVLPPEPWASAVFASRGTAAIRDLDAIRGATGATHRFCELMLARSMPADHVIVRRGGVAERVVEAARELDAELVVVGSGRAARRGRRVKTLLRRAGRPVLFAHSSARAKAIVAATDFSDSSFPALTRAAELGAKLRASVTFVHNLDWRREIGAAGAPGAPFLGRPVNEMMTDKRARLYHLAERLESPIDVVVLDRGRPVDAICEISEIRAADLVVVGAHRRRALVGEGTAESVLATLDCSVLAVPLGEPTLALVAA